jgi:hypothetical protein
MTVSRRFLCLTTLVLGLSPTACGRAPSDISEQTSELLSWPVPVALRLTTIKMNGRSVNPAMPVHVYVTLPGLTQTSTYIGDYAGQTATNLNSQFNCTTEDVLPGSDGYCTANLPTHSTIGPVKFIGKYPSGSNSQAASVQINGTRTNFTIDSTGHSSLTCASAWMMINNNIDGDKITVCWQTTMAIPFTAPPIPETVFYQAPGEESSVGLTQSNTISTHTVWTHAQGMSLNMNITAGKISDNLSITGGQTFASGTTITSGSSTGFTVPSTAMFPDPNNNIYVIIVAANASWLDYGDGTPPSVTTDLSSGNVETLTLGQLKGLAQNPQDVSTIPSGDRQIITKWITPSVAQQFVAQDPYNSGLALEQTVTSNPNRFIQANPPQMTLVRRPCSTCGDTSSTQTQVKGSGTDTSVGQSTGDTFSFGIAGIGFGANLTDTLTTTYSDTNQSTASITLKTHSLCVEGAVDLYMDKAFGTIVSVPHLEDSCNAPVNCSNGQQRVLLSGQSLGPGQSLISCNGQWSLFLQSDGMLVEQFVPDGSIATSFWTPGATSATMQTNGDFVVRDAAGNVLTDSGTASSSGAFLILQDDGFINIYNPLGNPAGGVGGALPALWSMAPGG